MPSQRVRALFGAADDPDYTESQVDFRSFTATVAGPLADGPYTWTLVTIQGPNVAVSHTRTGVEDENAVRDGWIANAMPGGAIRADLAPYLESVAATTTAGQVRARVRNSALLDAGGHTVPPFRPRAGVPPAGTITTSPDDCFPSTLWLPPAIGPLVVEIIPVNFAGNPITNPRGTTIPDDVGPGMTLDFELLAVNDRNLPFGPDPYGLEIEALPSYRRSETQAGWPVRELAIFPSWVGGLTSIRLYNPQNAPSAYQGLEVWFHW